VADAKAAPPRPSSLAFSGLIGQKAGVQKLLLASMAAILLNCASGLSARGSARGIPGSLPGNPGNVFTHGQRVVMPAPAGDAPAWQVIDYEGKPVAAGTVRDGQADLGTLSVGHYELLREGQGGTNRVSLGVLEALRAPTPENSPISSDVAMAWLVPAEKMKEAASLCALAGLNWTRDRLNWQEMEPAKGSFVASNRYDYSAQLQLAAGLQLLQVCHRSPAWANTNGARFPLDLRDAYDFYRGMARRWRGKVTAFEPWNEADISAFGGHSGSEMASLQKAAFLGLKAGNPEIIACLNVLALHRRSTLLDLAENEAWPYFDTFNLHHYEPFTNYPKLYADFRAASAGRPLWVTECSLPVKWSGDERSKEPRPEDLRVQSERVAITYALSVHEGAREVFYFVLPDYVEGPTQFGLLRPDLTPRPAYVALAAVGRLLAGAEPLGRVDARGVPMNAYLFRARPDGHRARVMVAWAEKPCEFLLPADPAACFDHLGRSCQLQARILKLGRAPMLVILADRTELPLIAPPQRPEPLSGKPSPAVFQALMPEPSLVLEKSGYKITPNRPMDISVFLYNFGSRKIRGRLNAVVPDGWSITVPQQVEIPPGERRKLELTLTATVDSATDNPRLCLTGEFGRDGRAVLSMRFVVTPKQG
jgi:hypothetical protein